MQAQSQHHHQHHRHDLKAALRSSCSCRAGGGGSALTSRGARAQLEQWHACAALPSTSSSAPHRNATTATANGAVEPWGSSSRRVGRLVGRTSQQQRRPAARASAAVGDAAAAEDGSLLETLVLGAMFASWYLANIVFNIYNKQVLKAFPFPLTCTTAQFFVGSVLVVALWATGAVARPQLNKELVLRVLPLAVVHTLGNLLTNVSLGAVAVSFTHTIKATEPIFSVALSALFLGDKPHPLVLATLLPIMGGVALASLAEATFNWAGFISAMGSNITFQSRNVLSKKLMLKSAAASTTSSSEQQAAAAGAGPSSSAACAPAAPLDNISLFSVITCLSFALLLPVNLAVEGWRLSPSALAGLGVSNPTEMLTRLFVAGVCFHAYQQISYMILARVSPVTHSIGNCVKRVVVIVSSVLFFRNPMTAQSAAGTAVALVGVFLYSQAKRLTKPKAC